MSSKKMSLEEKRSNFAWKVSNEGLDYAITGYFGGDISEQELEDPELMADWAEAHDILERIQAKLEEWQEEGE